MNSKALLLKTVEDRGMKSSTEMLTVKTAFNKKLISRWDRRTLPPER